MTNAEESSCLTLVRFDSWPGGTPGSAPGDSGHGGFYLTSCDSGSEMQQFVYDTHTKALRVAGMKDSEGCVDVGGCKSDIGAAIHLYNNTLGACGTRSDCRGTNEQWVFEKNDQTGAMNIRSGMQAAKDLCFAVVDGSASLTPCSSLTAQWSVSSTSPGNKPFAIETTQHDDQKCLTAVFPKPASGALEVSRAAVEARAEALFPSASTMEMSDGYRSAYATSDLLMEKIAAKRAEDNEQCKGGFGAPQGPLGEIYSTHTTINGMTWRYIVGVQVAHDFNVSAQALGVDAGQYAVYSYDDARIWKAPETLNSFDGGLTVRQSGDSLCNTSPSFNITTPCFPFQLHTVAPVASNGWVLIGETTKFVPVASLINTFGSLCVCVSVSVSVFDIHTYIRTCMHARTHALWSRYRGNELLRLQRCPTADSRLA